jgi:hypothetical protein
MKLLTWWMRYAQFFVLYRSAALRISVSLLSCFALTANPPTAGKQAHGRCVLRTAFVSRVDALRAIFNCVLARGRGSARTVKPSCALAAPTPCIVF